MPQASTDELWRKIVVIHNAAKAHLIYCEEAGLDHKTFLQPRNELCNALEHVIRAKSGELGLNEAAAQNPDYQLANLDKVLGHEYRAFFDVCDWLTVTLRSRIRTSLEPYAHHTEIILRVIPNYYSEIRPRLESLVSEISAIRTRKDIQGDLLKEVEEYNRIVSEMRTFADSLSEKIPGLEEMKAAKEGHARRDWRTAFWGPVVAAIIGALLTALAYHFITEAPKPAAEVSPATQAPAQPSK